MRLFEWWTYTMLFHCSVKENKVISKMFSPLLSSFYFLLLCMLYMHKAEHPYNFSLNKWLAGAMHNFLLVGLPNINILEPIDPEDCIPLLAGIQAEDTNAPSHFCRHNQTLLLPLTKNRDWKRSQPLQKGDTPNSIIPAW